MLWLKKQSSDLLQIFFFVAYKAYQYLQNSYWSKFDCPTQSPKTLLCERRGKTIRTGGGTVVYKGSGRSKIGLVDTL